jgi:hypothetical protein
MNTDDADPGNPSRQNEFRDEEQPDDLPPGPGGRHRRLGPDGVPVQDRWAEGPMYLFAAGCLIFGGVSAGLAVNNQHKSVALVAVGVLSALLSGGMAWPLLEEIIESKMRVGWVIRLALIVGFALAWVGFLGLTGLYKYAKGGD